MPEIIIKLESKIILRRDLGPGEYSMGSLPENDLVLGRREVSPRHARLHISPQGQASIEALGSTSGVLLQGVPVTGSPWLPGQTVIIKPYELILGLTGAAREAETVPVAKPARPTRQAPPERPSGRKPFILFVLAGLAISGGMAFMAYLDGLEKAATTPEPVAVQAVAEQKPQQNEEQRRLVAISLTEAREDLAAGRLQAAIGLLDSVLAADPAHAEAREMLQKAQAGARRAAVLTQQIQTAFSAGRHGEVLQIARELQALDSQNQTGPDLAAKSRAALGQGEPMRR